MYYLLETILKIFLKTMKVYIVKLLKKLFLKIYFKKSIFLKMNKRILPFRTR